MTIFYVYIMTNKHNKVFYVGVTNNLMRRVYEHKKKINKGFTKKYNINKLVYFDSFPTAYEAINAKKKIKAGSRIKKMKLVELNNKEWDDLAQSWY